jgi:biopolymer transport protein ExbB
MSVKRSVILAVLVTGPWLAAAHAAPAAAPSVDSSGGGRVAMAEIFFMQRHPATHRMEWFGSLIIWSLISLSAVSVGLMGARLWENRRDRILPDELARRGEGLLRDGRMAEFMDFLRLEPSDFGALLRAGLTAGGGRDDADGAMEAAQDSALARRLRRLEPLNIIGNVAPMIGLFGTVYGMILVFRAIVAAGGTPDPTNLAAGIGTKLVGTFWGLIVAIPALSAYAFLRNRAEGFSDEALEEAKRLVARAKPSAERGR